MKRKLILFTLLSAMLLELAGCKPATGWLQQDGKTVYAAPWGELVTGWQEIDGKHYFFAEDHALVTGWLKDSGHTYFTDANGAMVTGWQTIEGKDHYFDSEGRIVSGWFKNGMETMYLQEDGSPLTGWLTLEENRYYFDSNGLMLTGWLELEDGKWYFQNDGTLITGKVETPEGVYILNEDGTAYTGWLEENGNRYYYGADGKMTVGKAEIEGKTYYFSPHGVHILLVNPWNYVPDGYTVVLAIIEGYPVAEHCRDALAQMLADCRAAGFDPAICSTYRTQSDQDRLYKNKVKRVMALGYNEEEAKVIAATEVAVPGTSEHQLGLAIDIVDNNYWGLDEAQANMPAQIWLMEHCWEYGFILRYPIGSTEVTGIIYEPWHYRYVGVDISMELKELNITLEEYLGAADHE